jgi:hypothetical protein
MHTHPMKPRHAARGVPRPRPPCRARPSTWTIALAHDGLPAWRPDCACLLALSTPRRRRCWRCRPAWISMPRIFFQSSSRIAARVAAQFPAFETT